MGCTYPRGNTRRPIGYHTARRWYCPGHGESVELASIKSSPSVATVLTNRGVFESPRWSPLGRCGGKPQKGKSTTSTRCNIEFYDSLRHPTANCATLLPESISTVMDIPRAFFLN